MKTSDITRNSMKNGFTLLEILIAMFILSIVMTILYASYTTTFRNIDETEYQAEIYEMARTVMTRITEDLESAYIYIPPVDAVVDPDETPSTKFIGSESTLLDKKADTLNFSSRAHLDFQVDREEKGRANISYYILESDENETLTLLRSDTAEFEQPLSENEGGLVLGEDLVSVDFTFYDMSGETYETWDSTSDAFKDKLPKRVSIKLYFANRANEEAPFKFMTTVALQLATGEIP